MYIQRICAKLFTEVINVNTALSIQLRILGLNGIKPNFSELARMYGLDRRTVKKYYDGYEGKPAHHNNSSKLDKHLELIKQKLSLKGVNVRAVYEYILDEVDPDIGTYSNFNKYVKAKELKPKKTHKGHPRYETAPRHTGSGGLERGYHDQKQVWRELYISGVQLQTGILQISHIHLQVIQNKTGCDRLPHKIF